MTARATTLKGPAAGEYYIHELPNYYLDSDEPRGLWAGKGAEKLGLTGEIDEAQFLNVMAGMHPDHATLLLGRRYGDDSVRGIDVTASAPKSVSLLMGVGDEATKRHTLEAHDTAVGAMASWIEDSATTRFRVNGEIQTVDAQGLIMAKFRQHTSRALDPQLHTHLVIANKVSSPDGRWLALDARHLKKFQQAASARYHYVLRNELTARLGVQWQPVTNGIAEIAHMPPELLEEFSSRTDNIDRRLDQKIDRFVDNMQREPTPREHWKLEREAVLDSRPSKAKDVSAVELHRRWNQQAQDLGIQPDDLIDDITRAVTPRTITNEIAIQAIDDAIDTLSNRATWHPTELTQAIQASMPTDIVVPTDQMPAMLDHLTQHAIEHRCVNISRPIPDGAVLRSNGRPVTESPIDHALSTPEILTQERRILSWAERRLDHTALDSAEAPQRSALPLTMPQAEVAAAVAGDAHLTLVVGPAGTGKTTALRPAVDQLRADGRVVFGVAPSAAAADVLHQETGVDADTIDKLLVEHSLNRRPDHRYDLPASSTVIVDEAGMLSVDNFDRFSQLADERGWRVAFVGDPMQFTAVGRGGMFEHLIDTHGAIELDRVHRFTEPWERDASLRLRRGDPAVGDLYDQQGRLHGGTRTRMQDRALDAWEQARANGESVVLAAPNNDAVHQLNIAAQQRRIEAGELSTKGRSINASGHQLQAGDEIVTRRNHRQLTTDQSQPVRNRDRWTITTVHRNGDLTATGGSGSVRLPAHYVKEHVDLGYAQTSHATQGRTVDRSILYLDGPTDSRGIYVPMTRGRHSNDAYIATGPNTDALDLFTESVTRNWIDRPAHARQAELAAHPPSERPGTINSSELRKLIEQRSALTADLTSHAKNLDQLPRRLETLKHDHAQLTTDRHEVVRRFTKARETLERHDRPLRRRGHETEIRNAQNTVDHGPGKIAKLDARLNHNEQETAGVSRHLTAERKYASGAPALQAQLDDVTDALSKDVQNRSRFLQLNRPDRITEVLGDRPLGGEPSKAWDRAGGQLDQHQNAYQIKNGINTDVPALQRSGAYLDSRERTAGTHDSLKHVLRSQHEMSLKGPSLGMSR